MLGTEGGEGFVVKVQGLLGLALQTKCSGFFLTAKFKMGLKVFVSSTPEKADRVARLLLNLNQKMKSNWP